jgi:hypothetical protein
MKHHSGMDKLTWKGNSKQMYKAVMDVVPSLFKSKFKKMVEEWLVENSVEIITEELLLKMFYEKAPKAYAKKLGPVLEGMKTKK